MLKGTRALKYIEWGEKSEKDSEGNELRAFNKRPSCSNRSLWYETPRLFGNLFWAKESNERTGAYVSTEEMYCDCRLYYTYGDFKLQNAVNCTISALISEVLSRGGLGEGAKSLMVYEVNNLIIPDPKSLKIEKYLLEERELHSIFKECGIKPSFNIAEQEPKPLPDRAELDNIVFDALGLTQDERKEVYRAVCQLVWNRISKAKSV